MAGECPSAKWIGMDLNHTYPLKRESRLLTHDGRVEGYTPLVQILLIA